MHRLKNENSRISANLDAEVKALVEIETKAGQVAYQNGVYQLQLKELVELYPNLINEIKNLKVKPKRAESILTTSIQSQKELTIELRDSVIYDTIQVKTFAYSDQW